MDREKESTFDKAVRDIRTLRRRLNELENLIKYEAEKARERVLIKLDEAAELLGKHPRNIERMYERGEIHKYNKDGTIKTTNRKTAVYYDKQELLEADKN